MNKKSIKDVNVKGKRCLVCLNDYSIRFQVFLLVDVFGHGLDGVCGSDAIEVNAWYSVCDEFLALGLAPFDAQLGTVGVCLALHCFAGECLGQVYLECLGQDCQV